MKYLLLLALFGNFFLFNSCKKYKPAPAAFFIKPSLVSVATTGTTQGTANHKITDLYLYVGGKFQGAYQTGNIMPIVTNNKNVTIDIFAGIKNNGIKEASITWLFYDKIEFDTLVENGKTINRPLTFKYNPGVQFVWLENFEGNGFSLIKSNTGAGSDTTFKIASPGDTFEGSRSIELGLTGNGNVAQLETAIYYTLPKGNTNVYLEINYKCTAVFEVGVTDGLYLKSALNVNAQPNWNKIYIQLADAVNRAPSPNQHKIYFRMIKPNDNDNPRVWLDNIKLIYL